MFEDAGRGGERAAGVACEIARSRPPFAGSSEAFGSYQAKAAGPPCLHK